MDRLASMAAFVKAAEVGSFAAAASALRMSPQMIAKHVTWLETRLGTRLLNRTTRRQSLTDIGKAYYDRCKLVLADADWADSLADEAKGAPRGRLRVNAPVSFGTHSLTPVIARYLRQYPRVAVDLVLSDRFVDLVEEEFEAVFRIGPLADSSFMARELAPFRLVACASPDYLRERGVPATPFDLEAHECLAYASTSGPTANNWRFVRDQETYTVDVKHRLLVNDAKALLVAALNGFGIAFIAEDLAREGLRSGHLTKVLPDYEPPSRPIHVIYHPDRQQTPKLKSFISAVVSELG
ncbi:LysR family transcriptional regulator [Bradyrhizobium sp. Ce-3]|uniref:LysR family transcriptional regulator n=1 Tax=Bradyrhizobium sp. Ce-3 TaxID=2913970 RepID=UPI001FB90567|nr:LysR family transcriptional regulator [Bradyrhizobium sp. Ce-3]GKQ49328.1 LysR family transcriptional regulator [Bradyrhizobium sp. Ce-3]